MQQSAGLTKKLQALMLVSLLALTGCENGNLFGKLYDRGDSSDPAVLLSEGKAALKEGNYAEALKLFERALAQNPNSGEALLGAVTARINGVGGINFGQLVSNITVESASVSQDFSTLLRQATTAPSASAAGVNSILYGIDIDSLANVLDISICQLTRIASGNADASVPANSSDILVNLATMRILRALIKSINRNFVDIVNTNGDFDAEDLGQVNAICVSAVADDVAFVEDIGLDLAAAYALFDRTVVALNLGSDRTVTKIRDDVDGAIQDLLSGGSSVLPAGCKTTLGNINITAANYLSAGQAEAFSNPSGC